MAKFWLEDGSIKSGDRIMYELQQQKHEEELHDMNRNRDQLNQINLYDLLLKIQNGIIQDKCVVESLKGEKPKDCKNDCKSCIMKYLNQKQL